MTDELKTVETDAEAALGHVQTEIGKLAEAKIKAEGWVKTHVAVLIGSIAFIVGIGLGHWLTKHL